MALGTAGFTAGLAIVRMVHEGLKPDNGPVIVSGATGGVGSIAIEILSKQGYQVHALTGKAESADYLQAIGAHEIILRSSLDLTKIRPLGTASWAGAIDNLGGDVLSWIASTMQPNGTIASIGLAASMEFKTTVAPFILRGCRCWASIPVRSVSHCAARFGASWVANGGRTRLLRKHARSLSIICLMYSRIF